MKMKRFEELLSTNYIQVDRKDMNKEFKNFSEEFVKVYQDMEDEEQHLWIGAVGFFRTPF